MGIRVAVLVEDADALLSSVRDMPWIGVSSESRTEAKFA